MAGGRRDISSKPGAQSGGAELPPAIEDAFLGAGPNTEKGRPQISLRRVCGCDSALKHSFPGRNAGDLGEASDGVECVDDRTINILLLILIILLIILLFVG
jgi:hypothetical protein